MTAIADIAEERRRQIDVEGWSIKHDDTHNQGELAQAAGSYALYAGGAFVVTGPIPRIMDIWPWSKRWWKPSSPRRDLVKAGALIIAEIERLDRIKENKETWQIIEYDQVWNDAISAAAKACENCGAMATAVSGNDYASSVAFAAAVKSLAKIDEPE